VTLGTIALQAVAHIEAHHLVLARDVGRAVPWFERWLVPLYHPGPRALIRRPLEQQRADYSRLASLMAAGTILTERSSRGETYDSHRCT
jgi:hypothetical protein